MRQRDRNVRRGSAPETLRHPHFQKVAVATHGFDNHVSARLQERGRPGPGTIHRVRCPSYTTSRLRRSWPLPTLRHAPRWHTPARAARRRRARVAVLRRYLLDVLQQEDRRSPAGQLAAAQAAMEDSESAAAKRVVRPAQRRHDALAPSRQRFRRLWPCAVGKAVRYPAPRLRHLLRQGELGHYDRAVRNVVEGRCEIDARRIVVEADDPAARPAAIECSFARDRSRSGPSTAETRAGASDDEPTRLRSSRNSMKSPGSPSASSAAPPPAHWPRRREPPFPRLQLEADQRSAQRVNSRTIKAVLDLFRQRDAAGAAGRDLVLRQEVSDTASSDGRHSASPSPSASAGTSAGTSPSASTTGSAAAASSGD